MTVKIPTYRESVNSINPTALQRLVRDVTPTKGITPACFGESLFRILLHNALQDFEAAALEQAAKIADAHTSADTGNIAALIAEQIRALKGGANVDN